MSVDPLNTADVQAPVPDVAVLVPVTPGPYAVERLYREFSEPFRSAGIPFEFLFVVQFPEPEVVDPLRRLQAGGEPLRVLLSRNTPPEAALPGVVAEQVAAPVVVTLPSYPRIKPEGLLEILRPLAEEGMDFVSAARVNRNDKPANRLQRKAFHFLLRKMVGGGFSDIACGVRAMRREVLMELNLYGDTFRFVPMLAEREGFRVVERHVDPHPFDRKTRVYAPGVYLRRLIDLVGLMFLLRFTYKPLRFFGLIGSATAGTGAVILLALMVQRLGGQGIADRPLLLLGVLLVVLGLQALALGLVGEIVVHHSISGRPLYRVADPDTRGEAGERGGR